MRYGCFRPAQKGNTSCSPDEKTQNARDVAMKTLTLSLVSLTAFAGLLLGTNAARADHNHFGSVENYAAHLQDHSRELYYELRVHVGYGSSGRHLMSDTAEMYRLASRIRANAHSGWNLESMCRDARRLDSLVHHMEEIVDDLDHGHGHGHHHGSELRHITRLLRIIEDDTHELVDEIERLERHASARPMYSRPGIYLGGSGISVRFGN